MHFERCLSYVAIMAILASAAGRGQPAIPSTDSQDEKNTVFRADTRLVVLNATVMDENGRLVTNLPREAFAVFENGIHQEIKTFRSEDVPVSLGLVIDNSGSMRDKRAKVSANKPKSIPS